MRHLSILTIAGLALLLIAMPAEAQVSVGAQALYDDDLGDGSFGIGGRAAVDFEGTALGLTGDLNWYFPDCAVDDCQFWEAVVNARFLVPSEGTVMPYLGAGLAYQNVSTEDGGFSDSENDTGLNVVGGLEFQGNQSTAFFTEVSYRVMDDFGDQLVISAGVSF